MRKTLRRTINIQSVEDARTLLLRYIHDAYLDNDGTPLIGFYLVQAAVKLHTEGSKDDLDNRKVIGSMSADASLLFSDYENAQAQANAWIDGMFPVLELFPYTGTNRVSKFSVVVYAWDEANSGQGD